jgi:uncharacterized protein with HEPN domain
MIEISAAMMDGFVREWLKHTLETLEINLAREYVHPEDKETYEKDIEAVKRVLDFVGEAI